MITSDSPLSKIQLALLRAVGRRKERGREGGRKGGREEGRVGEREEERERGRERAVEEGGTAVEGESREQAEWLSELLRNSTVGRGMCMYACVRASCAYIGCLDVVLSIENVQGRKPLSFLICFFLSLILLSIIHSSVF